VIGQDSSRTQLVDGSQRTREQHLLLRFYAGDVIYMNIKVKRPTVEVTGYSAGANAPAGTLVTEQSYVLKITLANVVTGTGLRLTSIVGTDSNPSVLGMQSLLAANTQVLLLNTNERPYSYIYTYNGTGCRADYYPEYNNIQFREGPIGGNPDHYVLVGQLSRSGNAFVGGSLSVNFVEV
jgi:hypothetical protein